MPINQYFQRKPKEVPKKRRTRIDFKPFLFFRHIVCCPKIQAILSLLHKINFKTIFYKR